MEEFSISEEKIKAIVIYKFMYEFDKFEKKLKAYFNKKLNELNINDSNKLYFYCGGLVNKNVYIDFQNEMLCLNNYKFKTNSFNELTISQIISAAISNTLGEIFDLNISSIQNKYTEYDIKSSIKKLIHMRNKLAHDLSTLNLSDKDCIELLSIDTLNKHGEDIVYNLELKDDYDQIKFIFSNIIYMKKIYDKLCTL